ncbi:hypothetical protein OPIT5_17575 [Opitutaceae bacterium TAV5]|nr:hypothetical protein OPIT5_17575 [Opitutaceae bacterium TAV5]
MKPAPWQRGGVESELVVVKGIAAMDEGTEMNEEGNEEI